MMSHFILVVGFLLYFCLLGSQGQLQISPTNHGSYNISVDGKTWLINADTFFRVDGTKLSSNSSSLKLVHSDVMSGEDSLGDYKLISYLYKANGRSIKTGIKQYRHVSAAVFSQTFEDQFTNATARDPNNLVSGFPSFRTTELDVQLGCLGFLGLMSGFGHLTVQNWTEEMPKLTDGLESGPLVLFDKQNNVVIISPFNNFMAASFLHDSMTSALYWGIMGGIDTIPEDFLHETILYYSDQGINKAIEEWGHLMQKTYHRDSSARFLDPTVKYVGYYTDKGAYYYHKTEPGMNYEDTMLGYTKYSLQENIPYRYLQYDDWFYMVAGPGYGATVTWDANPKVFPHGLHYLYNKTTLPVIAHNRFWSSKATYAKENGGRYNFIMDGKNALPDDQDFWDYLFSQAKTWGLVNYEQDFLNFQVENLRPVRESLTLGRRWLMQMGEAAARYGIYLQYCMSLPRHILAALEIPAVSQARVSGDYGEVNQWKIGISSMLADAVGIAPFKDNFWTVSVQPGNNRVEVNPRREAVVALLSTGPVGPGDRIGYSNSTLINTMTTSDGTLLKPSKPATAIDAQIIQEAFGGSIGPIGEVWSTYSRIGHNEFGFVFASNLKKTFHLYLRHTKISPQAEQMVFSKPEYSPLALKPQVFDAQHPLVLNGCDEDHLCLYYTSPIFFTRGRNIIIIGEKDKMIHISPARVTAISVNDLDLLVTLKGAPGEVFQFGACPAINNTPDCFFFNCIIGGNGYAEWSLSRQSCQ